MPIHIPHVSRRRFLLAGSAAMGLTVVRTGWAAEATDANMFALLADTHVPDEPAIEARGVNMTANLRRVVEQLCEMQRKPAGVIVNGDCAYLKGLPDDYANFAKSVQPLRGAGLPLHLTMGNHDHRGHLYQTLAHQQPDERPVESKHVSVIQSPHANLFLLDSLREVNVVTGELGASQREWLARALDAHSGKPAVIVAHHNPQFEAPPEGARWTGLQDTAELFEMLSSRKHVKAYIYGHTHDWSIRKREGIHLVNLPPVAYVFADGKPNGWVRATLDDGGIRLELQSLDANHPQHGECVDLAWR